MDSRRCFTILSMMARMSASVRTTRSSTSFCFMADSSRRTVPRRAVSLARIAAFMSSVILLFNSINQNAPASGRGVQDLAVTVLVHLLRQQLAAQALVVALHGGGQLALSFRGRLIVELARAKFGEKAGLFHGALEAAHGHFKGLVFLDAYGRHAVPVS